MLEDGHSRRWETDCQVETGLGMFVAYTNKDGLTQPLVQYRRKASGDEIGQDRDGGMIWAHLQGTDLTLHQTGSYGRVDTIISQIK